MTAKLDFQLYINGEFCTAEDGAMFDSVNPSTGEVWARVPAAGEADVNRAVASAFARASHRALGGDDRNATW